MRTAPCRRRKASCACNRPADGLCAGPTAIQSRLLSGVLFRVEVEGELRLTRMEHLWSKGYYSVDGYKLRGGMRAAIGSRD